MILHSKQIKKSHSRWLLCHICKIQNGCRQPYWIFEFALMCEILYRNNPKNISMILFSKKWQFYVKYAWSLIFTHVRAAAILFLHIVQYFCKNSIGKCLGIHLEFLCKRKKFYDLLHYFYTIPIDYFSTCVLHIYLLCSSPPLNIQNFVSVFLLLH